MNEGKITIYKLNNDTQSPVIKNYLLQDIEELSMNVLFSSMAIQTEDDLFWQISYLYLFFMIEAFNTFTTAKWQYQTFNESSFPKPFDL